LVFGVVKNKLNILVYFKIKALYLPVYLLCIE
jgi:hypothetical protein